MTFSLSILFLSTISCLEAASTAFAQTDWKNYLLFIILTTINVPLVWCFLPETKGFSLEEVGEKIGDELVVHLTNFSEKEKRKLHEEVGEGNTTEHLELFEDSQKATA